ncbi:hypothetical protein M422DRAFT_166545 [Sphaerobolus stellatus SS14]|uniref:Small ribosomal subunit protein mS35 mitochondrial conserved domain-containing protein n=1 Tax=Sphaerobolus stellatus (strain SS14) TaxID=990650 RepID=A0A0C9W206_SPHS4|nr:hypothetical protein M422DRAFT_166545 [Sphaerobolus stellatus SS14]
MPEFMGDDSTSLGHMVIYEQKRLLHYLRLIEQDGPKLRQLRLPFNPPPMTATPLVVRAISYSGEAHPVIKKRVVVSAVSQLPLKTPEARHKFKLLAGPRWTEIPPRDGGIGVQEHEKFGGDGYIKISCEDFPEAAMNLKWIDDVMQNLIKEANDSTDTFKDIPIDKRHITTRIKKHGRGARRRLAVRPSLKDFPKEWLPTVIA